MRPVLCQTELYCRTEVVGFEPTVPITRHGILAGFCDKPTLPHFLNVAFNQPKVVLGCFKATMETTGLEPVLFRLSVECFTN